MCLFLNHGILRESRFFTKLSFICREIAHDNGMKTHHITGITSYLSHDFPLLINLQPIIKRSQAGGNMTVDVTLNLCITERGKD